MVDPQLSTCEIQCAALTILQVHGTGHGATQKLAVGQVFQTKEVEGGKKMNSAAGEVAEKEVFRVVCVVSSPAAAAAAAAAGGG